VTLRLTEAYVPEGGVLQALSSPPRGEDTSLSSSRFRRDKKEEEGVTPSSPLL